MAQHNADRVADWNDQSGERWVAHQDRLDAMLAVFGQAAIEAAAPATGERACATGYAGLLHPTWDTTLPSTCAACMATLVEFGRPHRPVENSGGDQQSLEPW